MHLSQESYSPPTLGKSIPYSVPCGDHYVVRSDEGADVVMREIYKGETRELFRSRLNRPGWREDFAARVASIIDTSPRVHFAASLPLNWVGAAAINDAAVVR